MKRIWKPLSVGGLRLYQVEMKFRLHPEWNKTLIVAARKPSHATRLIEDIYRNAEWEEEPHFFGSALNIYQPESWWEEGVLCEEDMDGGEK